MAKTNYKYEKRQKELAKQRKKEQKKMLKELKKANPQQESQGIDSEETQAPQNSSGDSQDLPLEGPEK